jgi:hypothetical protein
MYKHVYPGIQLTLWIENAIEDEHIRHDNTASTLVIPKQNVYKGIFFISVSMITVKMFV